MESNYNNPDVCVTYILYYVDTKKFYYNNNKTFSIKLKEYIATSKPKKHVNKANIGPKIKQITSYKVLHCYKAKYKELYLRY